MPTLAISKEFLPDYRSLPQEVQKKVDALFSKFAEHTHAGIHLEKLEQARDPRARSVRVDQAWRGVVLAPDEGDTYVLVRVMHHDKAYAWMERNVFGVNQATGALEIEDVVGLEAVAPNVGVTEEGETEGPFAGIKDKDLTRLGIPEKLLPVLRRISSEEELEGLTMYLPQGQADALSMLAAGYTAQEAYSELVAGEEPGSVDPQDVGAAVARPASRSMFYVVQEAAELLDILQRPFDLWRTFLHPTQRSLAYRDTYNGPARVTGGAGTGKTVVAMHRAKALGDRQPANGVKPILFTTYTKNLARSIKENLKLLGGPEILEQVDVLWVDKLAHRFVRDEEGIALKICSDQTQDRLWIDVVDELGIDELGLSAPFVRHEWQHVVLAHGIASRSEYLSVPRLGRGVRLDRKQRAAVWEGIEEFTNRLVELGQRTYLQIADAAAGYVAARSVKPYSHVIIDEAQDLHPAQWRMLRACVAEAPNDMFIVGDAHQRIYDNRISLSRVGVNVRGRSHRLRLNYRTTHEILRWSLGLLTGETFDDLDEGVDTLVGYRSQLHGPPPTVVGYPSRNQEFEGLATAIGNWIGSDVRGQEIGVAARTHETTAVVVDYLKSKGVKARELTGDDADGTQDAVNVGTMHRMKGLEYRCVAVVDVGRDRFPLRWAVTPEGDDPVQHRNDLQRERSLMYVASTRARDDLRVSWSGEPSPFIASLLPNSLKDSSSTSA